MTAFIGVRISWLIFARKADFARVARSATAFCRRRSLKGLLLMSQGFLALAAADALALPSAWFGFVLAPLVIALTVSVLTVPR